MGQLRHTILGHDDGVLGGAPDLVRIVNRFRHHNATGSPKQATIITTSAAASSAITTLAVVNAIVHNPYRCIP